MSRRDHAAMTKLFDPADPVYVEVSLMIQAALVKARAEQFDRHHRHHRHDHYEQPPQTQRRFRRRNRPEHQQH